MTRMDRESHLTHVAVPEGLAPGFGYSHVIIGSGRLVVVSGQVPFDAEGTIVGKGDIETQTRQVFENIQRCLHAAGADFRDVVKLTYYVTDMRHLRIMRTIRDGFIDTAHPPASTAIQVTGLAFPDFMVEIDALAVMAE